MKTIFLLNRTETLDIMAFHLQGQIGLTWNSFFENSEIFENSFRPEIARMDFLFISTEFFGPTGRNPQKVRIPFENMTDLTLQSYPYNKLFKI